MDTTRESSKVIKGMGKDNTFGKMGKATPESGVKESNADQAHGSQARATAILDSGSTEKLKAMGYT